MIRTGVMRGFGAAIRRVIGRITANRFKANAVGVVVGTILQSTTATALLACSFVSRASLTLAAALALMLGADLGATLAAQFFNAGVSGAWPLLMVVGYVLFMASGDTRPRVRHLGRISLGLGIVMLALSTIAQGAAAIQTSETIRDLVVSAASEPLIAIVFGALLTWLIYSSLGAILLVASLAGAGVAPPEAFLPLVLGVNLGAALPALSATLNDEIVARRVPVGNLVYRLIGVIISVPLLSFAYPYLVLLSAEPSQQIINAHMFFNIGLCLLFIWTVRPVGRLIAFMMPVPRESVDMWAPRNLEASFLETPSVAIGMAARETLRMGDLVENMLTQTIDVFRTDDMALRAAIVKSDDQVDKLHEEIKLYLTQLSREELDDDDSRRAIEIITFTTNLEHIGDIIDKNLMDLAEKKARGHLQFSDAGLAELTNMHEKLMDTLRLSLSVFMSTELNDARQLVGRKDQFRQLELDGIDQHLQRLRSGEVSSIQTSSLHLDILRDLKRINSHLTSVAYPILDRAGELSRSRLRKRETKSFH